MFKSIIIAPIAILALAVTVTPRAALARDDGAVAAGVIGGIAAGAIIGSQINRNDGYRERRRYRECRIERRDYEDRYGRLHVRTVRVCD